MKRIIIVGPPGSGKSSIGKSLSQSLGIKYVSSGDIARLMGERDPKVAEILRNGGLAPEEAMRTAIKNVITVGDSFILDGFPRNLQQLNLMYAWFIGKEFTFIDVHCDPQICMDRMAYRCRMDDMACQARIDYFNYHTKPMIATLYGSTDRVIRIDNNKPLAPTSMSFELEVEI